MLCGGTHSLHALVLVVGRLLDAVGVVLERGVTAGVVLLLLVQNPNHAKTTKNARHDNSGGEEAESTVGRKRPVWGTV